MNVCRRGKTGMVYCVDANGCLSSFREGGKELVGRQIWKVGGTIKTQDRETIVFEVVQVKCSFKNVFSLKFELVILIVASMCLWESDLFQSVTSCEIRFFFFVVVAILTCCLSPHRQWSQNRCFLNFLFFVDFCCFVIFSFSFFYVFGFLWSVFSCYSMFHIIDLLELAYSRWVVRYVASRRKTCCDVLKSITTLRGLHRSVCIGKRF